MQQTMMATTTRKLVSHKGTMLGVITFPAQWEDYLNMHDSVQFPIRQPLQTVYTTNIPEFTNVIGHIYRVPHELLKDAVALAGISLEEFEKQPGCSFSPSAAYLRSIIE